MEFFKLGLDNNSIIGTIKVPLNIDCKFIRDKYQSENKPFYFYDFLINDNHCNCNFQSETDIIFDYDNNAILNEISIEQVQVEIEDKFEPSQASLHIANLTTTNYIYYALGIGVELYTISKGSIRGYSKPFTSLEVLQSKTFKEVKDIIQNNFNSFYDYFLENATQENYIELVAKIGINFCKY